MHYSHSLVGWLGFGNVALDREHLFTAVPVVSLLLSIPFLATYLTHQLARQFDRELPDYLTIIYAYLPITLGFNLAYYIPAAIAEAGDILPVIARSFGFSGTGLPSLIWSMDVAAFVQGIVLLAVPGLSIYPLFKIPRRLLVSILPHCLLMVGFTVVLFGLIF